MFDSLHIDGCERSTEMVPTSRSVQILDGEDLQMGLFIYLFLGHLRTMVLNQQSQMKNHGPACSNSRPKYAVNFLRSWILQFVCASMLI